MSSTSASRASTACSPFRARVARRRAPSTPHRACRRSPVHGRRRGDSQPQSRRPGHTTKDSGPTRRADLVLRNHAPDLACDSPTGSRASRSASSRLSSAECRRDLIRRSSVSRRSFSALARREIARASACASATTPSASSAPAHELLGGALRGDERRAEQSLELLVADEVQLQLLDLVGEVRAIAQTSP